MACERFRTTNFKPESAAKIVKMNEIIEEYQGQGLRLTARQLYYQFVSRGLIPNQPAEYKKLTALLTDARYAGLVDWDSIEDRGREPNTPSEWSDLKSLTESALRSYRLPRWETQRSYVELWVEKQALAGVLEPLAREHHVTLMVNKGYSSASAMKESAERIKSKTIMNSERLDEIETELRECSDKYGQPSYEYTKLSERLGLELNADILRKSHIFYLGDHDPSGEDMVRDIAVRLREFGVLRLSVDKIALTMDQVEEYDPPPNPAKITDPRAAGYIAKYGPHSWEVDALPPNVLAQLIRDAFARVIDLQAMNKIKKQEEVDKKRLREVVAEISGG